MISIITCSRSAVLPAEMQENIASTVGVDYELITIDNSQNKYSIFQAYNRGIELAKGDIYCFVHDDVLFRTDGWGHIIEEIFEDKTIGQVGFGGGHYLPEVPAYWYDSAYISFHIMHSDKGELTLSSTQNFFHDGLAEVVAVDGVCMFFPSWVFKKIKFDEWTYTGFHFYDMDISMQIQQLNLKVVVTNKMLVLHFWEEEEKYSNRAYMQQFRKNKLMFYMKWKDAFPIVRGIHLTDGELSIIRNVYLQWQYYRNIYQSLAYRLGKCILHPNKRNILRLFGKCEHYF